MPTHSAEVRATRLRELLERLKRGEIVQNSQLRTWLGNDGYATYGAEWAQQQELRRELADKPEAIAEYERLLKQANFIYNKADAASQRGKRTAKRLFEQADTAFERLLERLQEIVQADPSLRAWFDRDTDWTFDGEVSTNPERVPQVVTSRSRLNNGGGVVRRERTKREIKFDAVERALDEISQPKAKPRLRALPDMKSLNPERD